jgi:hypothetical protein
VVEPDLPRASRPELMSRNKVMIIAAGNDTFVDADTFRYHHPLTRALLDRFAPSPSHAARSGMACLGINLPVIEKVLNQLSGSFAGIGVDQRHGSADEKRHALERWAAHVADLVSGRRSSNAVRRETRA